MNIKNLGKKLIEHRSPIMIGTGVALMLGGAVWACVQTVKATRAIDDMPVTTDVPDDAVYDVEEKVWERYDTETDTWQTFIAEPTEPAPIDKFKVAWPYYIGPGICLIGGTALVLTGAVTSWKYASQIMGESVIAKKGLEKLQEVVDERLGPEEAKTLNDEASKRAEADVRGADGEDPERTGRGADLFYEPLTGKYFYSDKATIRQAVESMDETFGHDGETTLADFLTYMNLGTADLAFAAHWDYDPQDCRHVSVGFENHEGRDDRVCLRVVFEPEPAIY